MAEDGLTNSFNPMGNAMPATQQSLDDQDPSHDPAAAVSRVNAQAEDAYWRRTFWRERYYSPGLDYEDFAPAYCVGYVGYAQYGGDYSEAERSLWANWERIKGDSRLSMEAAGQAMRAAWDRMAGRPKLHLVRRTFGARNLRQRQRIPSLKLVSSRA